jgi:hypothetical protein
MWNVETSLELNLLLKMKKEERFYQRYNLLKKLGRSSAL